MFGGYSQLGTGRPLGAQAPKFPFPSFSPAQTHKVRGIFFIAAENAYSFPSIARIEPARIANGGMAFLRYIHIAVGIIGRYGQVFSPVLKNGLGVFQLETYDLVYAFLNGSRCTRPESLPAWGFIPTGGA